MEESVALSRVYLCCRPIFSGQHAFLRKGSKVKQLVARSRGALSPLLEDIGEKRVIASLRQLLAGRIFESEDYAKVMFPSLFESSPARDLQRQDFEDAAKTSAATILHEIEAMEEAGFDWAEVEVSRSLELNEPLPPREAAAKVCEPQTETSKSLKLPSLYPSYFFYGTQHSILTKTQRVLEECCFEFATKNMPAVLERQKWDCAAAVELTQWTNVFTESKMTEFRTHEGKEVLRKVSRLRHTAVHRLPTTARGVCELLEFALRLTQYLQDDVRYTQLEATCGEVSSRIKAMEMNKNVLEHDATAKLQEIQRQREALDKAEADLIQATADSDRENRQLVRRLLEESIGRIFKTEPEWWKEAARVGRGEEGEKSELMAVQYGEKVELEEAQESETEEGDQFVDAEMDPDSSVP
ncbi:hypothetical protein GQ53DRAFT_861628 [Thozetella sp. PMI_491]|nr:hypothetical protein GQ53DRAFT_861628 [Thozetella sp. PMI_491]